MVFIQINRRRYQKKLRTRAALTVLGLVAAIPAFAKEPLLVADPAAPLAEAWTHRRFGAATEYKGIMFDGVAAIRAIGRNSASGLYRDVPTLAYVWTSGRIPEGSVVDSPYHAMRP